MLNEFEAAHARSITNPNPVLEPIPPLRRTSILVASVVRKPPEVLEAWLTTLAWQQFRQSVDVTFALIANFADADPFKDAAMAVLAKANVPVEEIPAPLGDYGDTAATRAWTANSFVRMAELKNRLIQRALDAKVDYLFLIDADVLCDPYTVQSLLDADAPIVSAVYWTNWQRALPGAADFVHAGPQVWLRHPYHLNDERYTESEFRARLIERKRTRVRGLGACTLIRADALASGVNFSRVDALPPGPMSEGEDRHFCARAQRLHIPMVAEPWPDVYHAYHPAEYPDIPQQLQRLGEVHPERPVLGTLVNIKIEPLEPVMDALGRQMMLSPKYVRGRLGVLPVLPQIEEEVAKLSVGESAIIRVMYPGHFALDWLRSQTRLMRVTLLDCKVARYAPVIQREMFAGSTGRYLDSTTLTEMQIRELLTSSAEVVE